MPGWPLARPREVTGNLIRPLLIKSLTRFSWSINRRRLASSVRRFADVEADSGWQALQLVRRCEAPELRGELLEMALEESAHARLFRNCALEFDPAVDQFWVPAGRKSLYTDKGGVLLALAEMMVSEKAVYKEFDAYLAASNDPRLSKVFETVRADEVSHGSTIDELLLRLAPDRRHLDRVTRRARLKRTLALVSAAAKAVAEAVIKALLGFLYLVFGLFYWVLTRLLGSLPGQRQL